MADDELTADVLEQRLAEERASWDRSLMAQEHRLIPAMGNLISALFHNDPAERRLRTPIAAMALAWCFVPSPGAAGIGLVALLSLLLSWQQVRLLRVQNERIQTQNILAEAQRRSGLIYEATAVLERVNAEKERAEAAGPCADPADARPCWRTDSSGTRLFVPSAGTIGRIAALTQALRPYRYLSVETEGPYRLLDDAGRKTVCPGEIPDAGISRVFANLRRRGAAAPRAITPAELREIAETYGKPKTGGVQRWLASLDPGRIFDRETSTRAVAELNCSPSSPERGQLLISLHAAQVDLSRIVAAGADFRYADAPGANLKGLRLDDADLSYARLPGASFSNGRLKGIDLRNADLAGAHFGGTELDRVWFDGATLQRYGERGTFVSFFQVGPRSPGTLEGVKIVALADEIDLGERFCAAGAIAGRLYQRYPDRNERMKRISAMREYALLAERSRDPQTGVDRVVAFLVANMGDRPSTLYRSAGGEIELTYSPFSQCTGWPSVDAPAAGT